MILWWYGLASHGADDEDDDVAHDRCGLCYTLGINRRHTLKDRKFYRSLVAGGVEEA